ncbi:6-phosphogluconolactonase [Arthrobacter sp. NPDC089319]|uniref:6-phosphogluconolactonase n=1 Tax=Arthrobacter sp. NPDC089319 TaxID=3155915 RepID=UPI00344109AE
MNAEPHVIVHSDVAAVAGATAQRLVERLAAAQAERGEATVVLTGGSLGINTLKAVAAVELPAGFDWSKVNVWWGDERFVAKDSPDRNERQAREALLDGLPLDPARVHPFGAAGEYADPDAAAVAYSAALRQAAADEGTSGPVPKLDVLLLGVGPDAHIASLFPEMAGIRTEDRSAVGETDAPKPPPERVSLTLPAINAADEVWLVVGGSDKAGAVGLALAGASPVQVPAAGARGRKRTVWLLDQDAASKLPETLLSPADNGND